MSINPCILNITSQNPINYYDLNGITVHLITLLVEASSRQSQVNIFPHTPSYGVLFRIVYLASEPPWFSLMSYERAGIQKVIPGSGVTANVRLSAEHNVAGSRQLL
ncbi:hypothetical protein J6590_077875 [Homalodisca vitripennis]|nr:hypothetical protein J6590_077875 [Homalodisca vitripennis]